MAILCLFFGDETSIGLAKASLDQISKGEEIRLIIEVSPSQNPVWHWNGSE
ncbi:hypothetical protein P4S72_16445 [Vibrio sp. PP-XX7]